MTMPIVPVSDHPDPAPDPAPEPRPQPPPPPPLVLPAEDTTPERLKAQVISSDPDGDGRPGVTSWPFVALILGVIALVLGAVLAILLTGAATWDQISSAIMGLGGLLGGAGATHSAHRMAGH